MPPRCISGARDAATPVHDRTDAVSGDRARTPIDPMIGRVVGAGYRITNLVKVGGMGRIYRALQLSLEREVAVKVLHPRRADPVASLERFRREALLVARLRHPNVVTIHDFGDVPDEGGAAPFLVMELLGGVDLAEWLAGGARPSLACSVEIVVQVLEALDEAHRLGIVHRDVKPENVVLEPARTGWQVKLVDFGIATTEESARRSTPGCILGTPEYMSPEQASGAVSPSTDLYGAGVILFQLLTGRVPFDGGSAGAVLLEHLTAPRPDPRDYVPARRIPAPLAEACMRALAVDPADRFPDARAFGRALGEAVAHLAYEPGRYTVIGATHGSTTAITLDGAPGTQRASAIGAALYAALGAIDAAPSRRTTEPERTVLPGSEADVER